MNPIESDPAASEPSGTLTMVVDSRRMVSDRVVELTLTLPDPRRLIPWSPGSHLELVLPSGLIRQYSLCGDFDADHLRIAVLLEPHGRGGSREVHEQLMVGSEIGVIGPKNRFCLEAANQYFFIAGGIGITPILSMIRRTTASHARWSLAYGGRTANSMAYVDEISELARRAGDRCELLQIAPANTHGRLDLRSLLRASAPDALIYACGPNSMISAICEIADEMGTSERVHIERFVAATPPDSALEDTDEPLEEFEVEIASSGTVLQVNAGQTILEVVRSVIPNVPASCEEGFCGTCETGVLKGTPRHRDSLLTEEERKANDVMMICVGRSLSPRLTLNL